MIIEKQEDFEMENKKNNPVANELNDDQLDEVTGGAINIFYDMPHNPVYYKYTCRDCGNVGIVLGHPDGCNACGSTNFASEVYDP